MDPGSFQESESDYGSQDDGSVENPNLLLSSNHQGKEAKRQLNTDTSSTTTSATTKQLHNNYPVCPRCFFNNSAQLAINKVGETEPQ